MTGWNMPPGTNVSDIPGNRPEDRAAEALYEKIYAALGPYAEDGEHPRLSIESLADNIFLLCGEVYQEGYRQGMADEAFANEYHQEQLRRDRDETESS